MVYNKLFQNFISAPKVGQVVWSCSKVVLSHFWKTKVVQVVSKVVLEFQKKMGNNQNNIWSCQKKVVILYF